MGPGWRRWTVPGGVMVVVALVVGLSWAGPAGRAGTGWHRSLAVVRHQVAPLPTTMPTVPPPTTTAPPPPPTTTSTTAPPAPLPPIPTPTLVARASVPSVAVYANPGGAGPSMALANPNNLGAPLVFLVRAEQGPWLQVMLPMRPNGAEGWVRASDVALETDDTQIEVSLNAHRLMVFRGSTVVDDVPVAVGRASAPTPTGFFYITELLKAPDPSGPYGPYAFGLSAFSNTYSEFEGGPGQIAIHGTDEPWVIGHDASHGCIRNYDANIVRLASEVPVGSPVTITA